VFSHGWPLSADDWDTQMLFFLGKGFRVIAHDRRGHGRSTQPGDGHDMDHYADDLAALTAHLDLKGAVHVGHSTGGGEVVHYLARHGESRVAKAVIISAVPPLMVKTATNSIGTRLKSCASRLRQRPEYFLRLQPWRVSLLQTQNSPTPVTRAETSAPASAHRMSGPFRLGHKAGTPAEDPPTPPRSWLTAHLSSL
jgi:pimeloyl-ACP methyl ester carboxylesterase